MKTNLARSLAFFDAKSRSSAIRCRIGSPTRDAKPHRTHHPCSLPLCRKSARAIREARDAAIRSSWCGIRHFRLPPSRVGGQSSGVRTGRSRYPGREKASHLRCRVCSSQRLPLGAHELCWRSIWYIITCRWIRPATCRRSSACLVCRITFHAKSCCAFSQSIARSAVRAASWSSTISTSMHSTPPRQVARMQRMQAAAEFSGERMLTGLNPETLSTELGTAGLRLRDQMNPMPDSGALF